MNFEESVKCGRAGAVATILLIYSERRGFGHDISRSFPEDDLCANLMRGEVLLPPRATMSLFIN